MHPLNPVPILSTILYHILGGDIALAGPSAALIGQFPHPLPISATTASTPPTPLCSLVCGAVLQPSAPGVGPCPISITAGLPPLPRPGMQTLRVPCEAPIFLPRARCLFPLLSNQAACRIPPPGMSRSLHIRCFTAVPPKPGIIPKIYPSATGNTYTRGRGYPVTPYFRKAMAMATATCNQSWPGTADIYSPCYSMPCVVNRWFLPF